MALLRKRRVEKSKNGRKIEQREKNPVALKIDPYSVAWMLKKKDKLVPIVVGHVPREISRFVSYFIHYGGRLAGIVLSPECKSSPIPKGGLETILKVKFSIEDSYRKVLKRLKELIDEYYDPVSVQRPSEPTEAPELGAKE